MGLKQFQLIQLSLKVSFHFSSQLIDIIPIADLVLKAFG
jgi:hypothetical protein